MARVLEGLHSFTCTPTRSSAIGMSHTCLCLPSRSWYSFTDPGGMEGCEDLGLGLRFLNSSLHVFVRKCEEYADIAVRLCALAVENIWRIKRETG